MIKVQVHTLDGQLVEDLSFEADEITVGRVKGNEVVLPVQGVSKRHARLSVRDGRLHVIDLKSTNGTLVRGQKITAPTPLHAHEVIRIADFHLRATWDAVARTASAPVPADDGIQTMAGTGPRQTRDLPGGPVVPMVGGAPPARSAAPTNVALAHAAPASAPPPVPPRATGSSPPPTPPSAVPRAADASPPQVQPGTSPSPSATAPTMSRDVTVRSNRPSSTVDSPPTGVGTRPLSTRAPGRATIPILRDARPAIATPSDGALAARAAVVPAVVRSHVEILEGATWPVSDEQRRAVEAAIARTIERDASASQLDAGARAELLTLLVDDIVGLGPLEHWLDDETIDAITVLGADDVWLQQAGTVRPAPWGFGSAELLAASVRRLAAAAGLDRTTGGTLTLPDGTTLHVTAAEHGPALLSAHRPATADWSLEALRRRGAIGPTAARLVDAALRGGGGVLVYGADPVARRALVEAFAGAVDDARVVACGDAPLRSRAGFLPRQPGTIAHAVTLASDLVVIDTLDADGLAELMMARPAWRPALLATSAATGPDAALASLAASTCASHGVSFDAARHWLAAAFTVIVHAADVDGAPALVQAWDVDADATIRPLCTTRSTDRTREHYRMGPAPGIAALIDAAVARGALPRGATADLRDATGGWVPDLDPA